METTFRDRTEAGRRLAELVAMRVPAAAPDPIVLALPRGGVPVAFEVARRLEATLDIFLVRKLGVPDHEELAMGALASGGVRVLNEEVITGLGVPPEEIERVTDAERRELERREQLYRGERPAPSVRGRAVILVDDGLATGSTMRAAVAAVRKLGPERIVVAVPTAAPSTCEEFRRLADDCLCVITPEPFRAVGLWYDDFAQTTDEEVRVLLARSARQEEPPASDLPAESGTEAWE